MPPGFTQCDGALTLTLAPLVTSHSSIADLKVEGFEEPAPVASTPGAFVAADVPMTPATPDYGSDLESMFFHRPSDVELVSSTAKVRACETLKKIHAPPLFLTPPYTLSFFLVSLVIGLPEEGGDG